MGCIRSMNRYHITLLVIAVVVASMMIIPVVAADDDDSDDIAPGERLAGSMSAQEAEIGTDIDERGFGQAIAAAAADDDMDTLADLIAERIERNTGNVSELEVRLSDLEARHEAGEISTGEFRAELAKLEVERQSIVRTSGVAMNATMGIPAELLDERGINVTAIELLRANASELGGHEVRDIARSIAGPNVGNASPERPSASDRMVDQVLRFDDANRSIDRAAHWIDQTNRSIERVTDRAERLNATDRSPAEEVPDEVWVYLGNATTSIEEANILLDDARAELADGNETEANELAVAAVEHAVTANEYAQRASNMLHGPVGGPPAGGPPNGPPGGR